MKMTRSLIQLSVAVLGVGLTVVSGCAPAVKIDPKANTSPVVSGKEQIKQRLSATASSGTGGSALGGVREALLELKKSEAPLADQLLQDLDKLEPLENAEEIKALATQMMGKL